jgi:hypothetical protein
MVVSIFYPKKNGMFTIMIIGPLLKEIRDKRNKRREKNMRKIGKIN